MKEPDAAHIDVLIVFGGDGTVLSAIDQYVCEGIPIWGINLGRLGFLLETQTQELPGAFDMLGGWSIPDRKKNGSARARNLQRARN